MALGWLRRRRIAYDFVDVGSWQGASMEFAQRTFGAKTGLGIEIGVKNLPTLARSGFSAVVADFRQHVLRDHSASFVLLSHVLEHLSNLDEVFDVLDSAVRVARDFVVILGPCFDFDDYLEGLELKFYWSDWRGHSCHVRVSDIEMRLEAMGLRRRRTFFCYEVESSEHPAIHPLASPPEQHSYDPDAHPPKDRVRFEHCIYREWATIISLRRFVGWQNAVERLREARKGVALEDARLPI